MEQIWYALYPEIKTLSFDIGEQFESPDSKSWFELFFEAFQDSTVIVLVVSAVVSLVVGLYESLTTGWIEGSAILVAVIIVAVVTATNDYMKEVSMLFFHIPTLNIMC